MKRSRIFVAILALAAVAVILLPLFVFWQGSRFVAASVADLSEANVAIVFGAGILNESTPSDMLYDRLEVASELYREGKADMILVSGDNRFENYNEPQVMTDTLVEKFGVPSEHIAADFAGRRTYDTCIRAKTLWGIDRAILVTQGYHLPRAIFTCRALGIEAVGVSASLREYRYELKNNLRETAALYNAFLDVYVAPPSYVGGEFLTDLDP